MNARTHDVIVVGLGVMGLAALRELARRGADAVGIEQFRVGHDRGSSHGPSRVFRRAYFEHADYVPLLTRAQDQWRALEAEGVEHVLDDGVGLVMMGPPDGELVGPTLVAAQQHGLPVRRIDDAELAARAPGLRRPDGCQALWDPDGAILRADACVQALRRGALASGAQVHEGEAVVGIESEAGGVVVRTTTGRHAARRAIVTAGPWTGRLLGDLGLPLQVRRKVVFWHHALDAEAWRLGRAPLFIVERPYGHVYGFPDIDGDGVKVAEHSGGQDIRSPEHEPGLLPGDNDACCRAIGEWLTGLAPHAHRHATCLYTMTPDANFIVDEHPRQRGVVIAAGFSGHGFKLAPVIGEALADLALDGSTRLPIEFLRLERPSLRT